MYAPGHRQEGVSFRVTKNQKERECFNACVLRRHLKVHGEFFLGHPTELQDDTIEIFGRNELEVLHAGHRHPAVEVEHVSPNL